MSGHKHPQYPERCRHFRGIQNTCGAGIDPMTLRDISGPGMARWPCLTLLGRSPSETACAARNLLSPEDFDREEAEHDVAVSKAVYALADGKCPSCGGSTDQTRVIGRCRYGVCGHRLGQVMTDDE